MCWILCMDSTPRPILRCANPDEYIKDGGTIVRVWIGKGIKKSLLYDRFLEERIPLSEILERLCPSLDCNLYVGVLKQRQSYHAMIG